jgi:opacity protein-like surface antigen
MRKMRYLFFVTFFLFNSINSTAQIKFDYGFKLGAGISNQSWDYQADVDLDFDNKIGISPRAFVNFLELPFFQMQAELGYLQKGFEDKVPVTTAAQPQGTGNFITVNNRLNYFLFSILAKFQYETAILSPYIIAGPQLNILLSKDIEKGWENVFDKFVETNIDLSIGVGAELKNLLPITILLEYRYERDFIDNFDSPTITIKNYSHVFLLGINL